MLSRQQVFYKKLFLKILQNLQETAVSELLFYKSCMTKGCNFIKIETLAQVFYCEFGEIFNNTFFYRKPLVAASDAENLQRIASF